MLIRFKNRNLRDKPSHRDNDLPAIIQFEICQCWYKNGKYHREGDLPAIEYDNEPNEKAGTKEWYKNGERHRDNNLPAIEFSFGLNKWFRDGIEYSLA